MFAGKKPDPSHQEPENVAKKSIKHMDAVVTGVILSGIIASLYGVKKLRDKEHDLTESHRELDPVIVPKKGFFSRIFSQK